MGQQQLLLLVLGIIIVGMAVISGIEAFDINRQKAREDAEHQLIMELASHAQVWKTKPAILGGGENGDPADYSSFTIDVLGLTASNGASGSPIVSIPGGGCFRFFSYDDHLRINSLDETCEIGTWTKGALISGTTADDITWEYRDN